RADPRRAAAARHALHVQHRLARALERPDAVGPARPHSGRLRRARRHLRRRGDRDVRRARCGGARDLLGRRALPAARAGLGVPRPRPHLACAARAHRRSRAAGLAPRLSRHAPPALHRDGVATGEVKTANYRGAFLRRWRSGFGLSLVADYNNNDGIQGSSSTAFNSVDLWVKAEYVPSARFGASYQTLSSRWHRSEGHLTADWNPQRRDGIFRVFAAARDDGVGLRAQATFATTSVTRDGAVPDRSLSQGTLEVTNDWSRAHIGLALRRLDTARPWQLEGTGAW